MVGAAPPSVGKMGVLIGISASKKRKFGNPKKMRDQSRDVGSLSLGDLEDMSADFAERGGRTLGGGVDVNSRTEMDQRKTYSRHSPPAGKPYVIAWG